MSKALLGIATRREFAQALAALATIAVAPVAVEASARPSAEDVATAVETLIRNRFGNHLAEEQIVKLRDSVLRQRFSADRLKRVELDNSDDPIAAFRADLP